MKIGGVLISLNVKAKKPFAWLQIDSLPSVEFSYLLGQRANSHPVG
jgi:hypothetical protein